MSKLLVISDIHNRWEKASSIIQNNTYDKIVFLGDILDNREETEREVEDTCLWFNEQIQRPDFIWIAGNHCLPYIYPHTHTFRCHKNHSRNQTIFDSIIGENRNLHKLFYYENSILFSHAGFQYNIVAEFGSNLALFENKLINQLKNNTYNKLFHAGMARGGYEYKGGFTWLDFDDEFEVVDNLNQVVGHTRQYTDLPSVKVSRSSLNICLDTGNDHYLISEDNNIKIYSYKHSLLSSYSIKEQDQQHINA